MSFDFEYLYSSNVNNSFAGLINSILLTTETIALNPILVIRSLLGRAYTFFKCFDFQAKSNDRASGEGPIAHGKQKTYQKLEGVRTGNVRTTKQIPNPDFMAKRP